ncbi:MAG: 30S ribosomal protein S15 [Chloroflexi bacterium]|nr:30S ribosomal protein S15 [Chloroflexota bacterium]
MALGKGEKAAIVAQHAKSSNDTGSSAVQVAILTTRINQLNEHLRMHKHDQSSRAGLLKLVGKRRSLLKYMASNESEAYRALLAKLGLRK